MGNSSQISNLQTELKYLDKLKCYRILSDSRGPPPWGGARWVDGGGGWYGCVRRCSMHACMHMHAHACTHACTYMLNMLNMLNMDASMSVAICNFYTCINVCVCMCMCVGTPPHASRCPPPTCPLPRAAGSPKHQTNRDNSILFEDSLPLNIPELI